jgi:hypothetical protein
MTPPIRGKISFATCSSREHTSINKTRCSISEE